MTENTKFRPDLQENTGKQRIKNDELGPNSEIGLKLRALYATIQEETIPDRFLDLLDKLDQIERCGAAGSGN